MTAYAESGRATQSNALSVELATQMSIIALAKSTWLSSSESSPDTGVPFRGVPIWPRLVLCLVVQQKRKGGGSIAGRAYGWAKALNALILAYGDRITIQQP